MKLTISGASGKTGFRIAEEATKKNYDVNLITRRKSVLPESLTSCKHFPLSIYNNEELDKALKGRDALIIATGARANIDLTGPAKVDALGVIKQIESCKRVGVKRIILISSLCVGKVFHPLNIFGFILLWKKVGEESLINSGIDWTIIRPGGLNEQEKNLDKQFLYYTARGFQEEGSVPRRLVARCSIEALELSSSIGKTIEITSSEEKNSQTMKKALESFII